MQKCKWFLVAVSPWKDDAISYLYGKGNQIFFDHHIYWIFQWINSTLQLAKNVLKSFLVANKYMITCFKSLSIAEYRFAVHPLQFFSFFLCLHRADVLRVHDGHVVSLNFLWPKLCKQIKQNQPKSSCLFYFIKWISFSWCLKFPTWS